MIGTPKFQMGRVTMTTPFWGCLLTFDKSYLCPCVRLSNGDKSVFYKDGWRYQTQTTPMAVPGLWFLTPNVLMKFQLGHRNGGSKYTWHRKDLRRSINNSLHLENGTRKTHSFWATVCKNIMSASATQGGHNQQWIQNKDEHKNCQMTSAEHFTKPYASTTVHLPMLCLVHSQKKHAVPR